MQNSRTNKAMKNVLITTLCQIIYLLVSFICRTVFTRTLGAEYLGLNGLFSNVLTMLSFVELGIGSALVYKMYKPLAMNDEHMLCVYIRFYKKIYIGIAIIVAVIGLGLIPFLHNHLRYLSVLPHGPDRLRHIIYQAYGHIILQYFPLRWYRCQYKVPCGTVETYPE